MRRTISLNISLCALAIVFAACHSPQRKESIGSTPAPKKAVPPANEPGVQTPASPVKQAMLPSGKISTNPSGFKKIAGIRLLVTDQAKVTLMTGRDFMSVIDGNVVFPADAEAIWKKNPSLTYCHLIGGSNKEFGVLSSNSELEIVSVADTQPMVKTRNLQVTLKHGTNTVQMLCTRGVNAAEGKNDRFTWEDLEQAFAGIFKIESEG